MTTNKPTIEEALEEFYKLKSKYENDYKEKYLVPIVKNIKKNARQKRVDYSKLPLHPCINCGRNVGSIFSIKQHDAELKRTYSIKCGDSKEPCPLNILFHYSNRSLYEDTINELLTSMEELKTDIIKEKNNALFFSNGNPLDRFEEITAELKRTAELVGSLIEQNILQTDNPVRAEETRKLIYKFNTNYVRPFKTMIDRYSQYSSEVDITEATRFYTEEMIKIIEEIQRLKFHINNVEYDDVKKTFTLIQKKNTLEDKEYFYGGDDDVVHFVKGNSLYGHALKQKKRTKNAIEEQRQREQEQEEQEKQEEQRLQEEQEEIRKIPKIKIKKARATATVKNKNKQIITEEKPLSPIKADELNVQRHNKTAKVRRIDRRLQLVEDSQESPI